MGKTLLGSPGKQIGTTNLQTPEQQSFLGQSLGQTDRAQGALGNLLQPFSEDFFQRSVIDPAQKTFQQQTLPGIGQQFASEGGTSSSALNQALAQASQDLAGSLADKRLGLQQLQGQQNQGALNLLGGLSGQRTFEPNFQGPQEGLLGSIISALGAAAGGAFGGAPGANAGAQLGRVVPRNPGIVPLTSRFNSDNQFGLPNFLDR